MKIDTRDMTEAEWLAERNNGIGGSDISCILGYNPWKSAYQLWLEKSNLVAAADLSGSEPIYWGHALEDLVAKEFAKRTGKKIRKANAMFCDPGHPFLRANVDREVVGENAVLECKTTDKRNAEKWEGGNVPLNYQLQCQWYMMVRGYGKAYIACLIGGNQFAWTELERDDELIALMKEAAVAFWEVNVQNGIAPEVTHMDKEAFRHVALKEAATELPDGTAEKLALLAEVKAEAKRLEETKRQIEAEIKQGLAGHSTGTAGNFVVSWKRSEQSRFDGKGFQKDHPDTYAQYQKATSVERLTVREIT